MLPAGWNFKAEEAASRVIGKVMYCRFEVGFLLVYLLFRNVCWHCCCFWIYKFDSINVWFIYSNQEIVVQSKVFEFIISLAGMRSKICHKDGITRQDSELVRLE